MTFQFSGIDALMIIFVVVAFFGAAHLAATATPTNPVSQIWLSLGF